MSMPRLSTAAYMMFTQRCMQCKKTTLYSLHTKRDKPSYIKTHLRGAELEEREHRLEDIVVPFVGRVVPVSIPEIAHLSRCWSVKVGVWPSATARLNRKSVVWGKRVA